VYRSSFCGALAEYFSAKLVVIITIAVQAQLSPIPKAIPAGITVIYTEQQSNTSSQFSETNKNF